MIAFQVFLNGSKACLAGVGECGVLSAHVTWVRRKREETPSDGTNGPEEELTMDVGGLIALTEEQVCWHEHSALRVGDVVCIEIVETDAVDGPPIRKPPEPVRDEQAQKRYVKAMAQRFGWKIDTGEDEDNEDHDGANG